jgi:uncharacterized protein (DUF2342 family)
MNQFHEICNTTFGDPDRVRTARRAFREIQQRNHTSDNQFTEVQSYTSDSELNELLRIESLIEGFSSELLEAIIDHDVPTTVDACATLLERLDNRLSPVRAYLESKGQ